MAWRAHFAVLALTYLLVYYVAYTYTHTILLFFSIIVGVYEQSVVFLYSFSSPSAAVAVTCAWNGHPISHGKNQEEAFIVRCKSVQQSVRTETQQIF